MQSAHLILFIISYANAHIVIITSSCIAALAIYSDSGNCYSCNGVIIMSVCVSVGLIDMTMSHAKMANEIEMPFWDVGRVSPRNCVILSTP